MRDIAIDFKGMCSLDPGREVVDRNATGQKCLVVALTVRGTDALYPDKGTDLVADFVGVNIVDAETSVHMLNFAALDALYFINATDGLEPDAYEGLAEYDLDVMSYDARTATAAIASTVHYPDGSQTTTPITINVNARY